MSKIYLFSKTDDGDTNIILTIKANNEDEVLNKIKKNYTEKIDTLVHEYLNSFLLGEDCYVEFAKKHKLFTEIKDKDKLSLKIEEYIEDILLDDPSDSFNERKKFFKKYYNDFLSWFPFGYESEYISGRRDFDYNVIDSQKTLN
jgi:hypothetical protein